MRIAQLAPPWITVPPSGYGGIEWVVAELCDHLVARGHEVTLYAPGGSSTSARLVAPFDAPAGTDQIGRLYPELVHALTCYLEADRYDVIHDHCGLAGPALGAFCPTPVVVTLHGAFVPEMVRFWRLVGPRLRFVAISDSQRSGMPDLPYLATIPNGVDVSSFPFTEAKEDYLAYVGRFAPEKGADVAIEVAHRLSLPIVLAGKSAEPHEKEFLATRVLPALRPNDQYRGEVSEEEKRRILAGARCTLFPVQWQEPFGLVLTESMACGTPVVAFGNGAVPEVVADGLTGFIVSDLEGMVEAVRRVGSIRPEACRSWVQERFSSEAMTDAYERIFERLVRPG